MEQNNVMAIIMNQTKNILKIQNLFKFKIFFSKILAANLAVLNFFVSYLSVSGFNTPKNSFNTGKEINELEFPAEVFNFPENTTFKKFLLGEVVPSEFLRDIIFKKSQSGVLQCFPENTTFEKFSQLGEEVPSEFLRYIIFKNFKQWSEEYEEQCCTLVKILKNISTFEEREKFIEFSLMAIILAKLCIKIILMGIDLKEFEKLNEIVRIINTGFIFDFASENPLKKDDTHKTAAKRLGDLKEPISYFSILLETLEIFFRASAFGFYELVNAAAINRNTQFVNIRLLGGPTLNISVDKLKLNVFELQDPELDNYEVGLPFSIAAFEVKNGEYEILKNNFFSPSELSNSLLDQKIPTEENNLKTMFSNLKYTITPLRYLYKLLINLYIAKENSSFLSEMLFQWNQSDRLGN
ncbi:MAG: hypothetical protein LBJ32_03190 [Oscillospiraceae bacterium]|nr:hypothetical protein [Oscillospiraceae bacterium]